MKKSNAAAQINNDLRAEVVNQQKFNWKAWNAGLSQYVFGAQQPQAVEIEKAILGAIILDRHALREVQHILQPDHFYEDNHKEIYRTCVELTEEQVPVDMLTVTERLRQRSKLDIVGGSMYIVELCNRVASAANIAYHARIVAERWLEREAIRLFTNGIKAIYEHTDDVFTLRNGISESLRVMPFSSYLRVRDANAVLLEAIEQPDMKQLASTLLEQQGITLLFAQPGVGKSIFAVQIADAVSRGRQVFPEGILNNEAGPMRTGFFDFELLDKEFYKRYSNREDPLNTFSFSDTFFRIDINPNFTEFSGEGDVEKHILQEIENAVLTFKLEFLVIDNITSLISQSAHDPNVALRVMASLKRLRIKYGLTLLVLAHTTKQYNKTKPIEMEDMSGAAALQNFAPTIFSIGKNANDDGELYIKQVKGRNGCLFGKDNIIRAEIHKRNGNFLCFDYRGQGREEDMLAAFLAVDTQDHLIQAAIDHQNRTGDGLRQTAKAIGWAQSYVTLGARMKEARLKGANTVYELQKATTAPDATATVPNPRDETLPF
jgi:KaiC/GvpD/RAD55 family RecA-like ATPase